jgi:hypothetical protein
MRARPRLRDLGVVSGKNLFRNGGRRDRPRGRTTGGTARSAAAGI